MVEQGQSNLAPVIAWALRQCHQRLVDLVDGLSDKQLAWSPVAGDHSLAFCLWHIARCDDNYLRTHIGGRPEIWGEKGWARRWGMDPESTGMLLSDEQAASLRLPSKEDVLSYARRVWDKVEAFVAGLGPTEMAQPVNHVERTRGLALGRLIMTHIYGHDNRHIGEMEYIKGLPGLRESVTL